MVEPLGEIILGQVLQGIAVVATRQTERKKLRGQNEIFIAICTITIGTKLIQIPLNLKVN